MIQVVQYIIIMYGMYLKMVVVGVIIIQQIYYIGNKQKTHPFLDELVVLGLLFNIFSTDGCIDDKTVIYYPNASYAIPTIECPDVLSFLAHYGPVLLCLMALLI